MNEIQDVAEAEQAHPQRQWQKRRPAARAVDREGPSDRAEQQQIGDRISEVGRNFRRIAAEGAEHCVETDSGTGTGGREGRRETVEPLIRASMPRALSREQDYGSEHQRVEAEIADVGYGRDGDRSHLCSEHLVVGVRSNPQDAAEPHEKPDQSLLRNTCRADQAERRSRPHDRLVGGRTKEDTPALPGTEEDVDLIADQPGGDERGNDDPGRRSPA